MGEYDGKFFFCLGDDMHDRKWQGPFNTRTEALAEAQDCAKPDGAMETFKAVSRDALDFAPDARWFLEQFLDCVSDEYVKQVTDDISFSFLGLKDSENAELTQMLRETFGRWLKKHAIYPDLYLETEVEAHAATSA